MELAILAVVSSGGLMNNYLNFIFRFKGGRILKPFSTIFQLYRVQFYFTNNWTVKKIFNLLKCDLLRKYMVDYLASENVFENDHSFNNKPGHMEGYG
jgi:hypothetical protein